ncbi:MAG: glycosyltransferase family 2 protein [Ectothiorhodospiraceae bacterium]|nr:glycosyltransferase family 2 protein [Ectothiorhodospiraceae bacterium]
MDLSVIVPLYNEEDSVGPMYEAIDKAVAPLGLEYEILFVDDGSSDATFARARDLAKQDPRLRVITFRRNYGQTPAMAAGIDHARGKILVTMDGDLQNDPSDIPNFIAKMDEGYDIVVGWRHKRQDKLITRKIPSVIANWLIGKVTGVPIKDNGCSLKAYRADIIQKIPLYSEMHRFIPAMTSIAGTKVAEIKVKHHARQFGVSKYGLSRIYKVLLDLLTIKTITSFASRPLIWFAMLAMPIAFIGMTAFAISLFDVVTGDAALSIPLMGLAVLLGTLVCFLILSGALAELIYKMGDIDLGKLSLLTTKTILPGNAQSTNSTNTRQGESNE